jgi:PAS domain S-box-containing protein
MLGYQRGELQEKFESWYALIHPEDVGMVLQKQRDYMEGRSKDFQLEYRLRHKDGKYRLIYANGKAKKDENGNVISLTGFHVDITEQRKQEVTYRLLSENSGDIIALHDLNSHATVYVSRAVEEVLGYSTEELQGHSVESLLHEQDLHEIVLPAANELVERDGERTLTVRIKHKSGEFKWFESKIRTWRGSEQEGRYVQSVSRDITERMRTEEEKAAALQRSLELNALKSGFVSMASHQFRTPLTVIYSNMELLEMACGRESEAMAERVKRVSGRIKDEVERMTELMNNILIFGSYEAGQTKVNMEEIALDKLLHKINELYYLNEPDGRKLQIDVQGPPRSIVGDEMLLTHAFSNVLSNAFKYSKGAAAPQLRMIFDEEAVTVQVRDFGLGIPESDLPYLFNSFFRASNVSTIVGSGLGLPIVKEFIEKHGGTVLLESREGAGTTVTIKLSYGQN